MPRSRRNLAWLAAVGLCAALVGCSRAPAPTSGGPSGRVPERARTGAEALALSGVTSAAEHVAKAEPSLYVPPNPSVGEVREQRAAERFEPTVYAFAGVAALLLTAYLFLRLTRGAGGTHQLAPG